MTNNAHAGNPPQLQWYRALLLVAVALCAYLSIPLLSGESVLVPSFPTVALSPLLLLAAWSNISAADIVFVAKASFVLLLSIALSPGYEYLIDKFFALVQCAMALGIAVLLVRLMQQLNRRVLDRTLLFLWLLIIVGSILELMGVIRDVSDTFREWAYDAAYHVYDGQYRDINMVGWLRPKFFSVEPSHVTKFFIATINSWLLIRVTWFRVAAVAAGTLAMLVIMGSPMLLVSAIITLAIVTWDHRASIQAKLTMVLGTLLVAVIFGALSGGTQYSAIVARLSRAEESLTAQTRTPNSEAQRMVYPYISLADTWKRWPLFGAGIGGKEVVAENTRLTLLRRPQAALGNNAMAELGIYLGLVGGAWFVYLLLQQARHTGVRRIGLIAAIVVLFSQLMGGMETFRYWGFIALLWGAVAVADAQPDGLESSGEDSARLQV